MKSPFLFTIQALTPELTPELLTYTLLGLAASIQGDTEETPSRGSAMAHYYYFPFAPDTGDDDQALAKKAVVAKYTHGRATVKQNHQRTDWKGEVDRPMFGKVLYDGKMNEPTRPNKKYLKQGTAVEIQCTSYKTVTGGFVQDPTTLKWKDTPRKEDWVIGSDRPLTRVKAHDVLIVDGHGNETSSLISNKDNLVKPDAVKLRPNELATILLQQGLNDGVIVKLTVCYGGGTYGSDPYADENKIYAKKLALLIAGFKSNVIVGGYAGKLVVGGTDQPGGYLGKNFHPFVSTVENKDGRKDLAKVNLRYYNGQGKLVARPGKIRRVRGVDLHALNL